MICPNSSLGKSNNRHSIHFIIRDKISYTAT